MLKWAKQFVLHHFPRVYRTASRAWRASTIRYVYQRRRESLEWTAAFSKGAIDDDSQIIDRVVASYLRRAETPTGLWAEIYLDRHSDVHKAAVSGDRPRIEEILREPLTSDLMYGFDSMAKSLRRGGMRIEDLHSPALTLDALISLAEAIGARRVENPESYKPRPRRAGAEEVIDQIERSLNLVIPLPNFFPLEFGLASSRGVISYRVPQALWQAWRISQLLQGISSPRILEIGGGLGRTALYARKFGLTNYTIVDIPISSLAQGYFLGRALGGDAVRLDGEGDQAVSGNTINLMSPKHFLERSERYDLIVNIDSLTEIGTEFASQYVTAIQKRAGIFLSVNHEANEFTVAELMRNSGRVTQKSRNPHWMRRGYVEEVFYFAD